MSQTIQASPMESVAMEGLIYRVPGKSLAVAQYLLGRCMAAGREATALYLCKLSYVAHGYMLGLHRRRLLDEEVQAWELGPMVSSIYQALRGHKGAPVDAVPGASRAYPFSDDETDAMDLVARTYAQANAIELSAAAHKPGTPWSVVRAATKRNCGIPDDLIASFYADMLRRGGRHASL